MSAVNANISNAVKDAPGEAALVADLLERIDTDVPEAQDDPLAAKVAQMSAANRGRTNDQEFKVGDMALLSTFRRRQAYIRRVDNRVAKSVVRYDGSYEVLPTFRLHTRT
ncbi:hypothetical protein BD311DRAFT_790703 [Dichomitus squalens]|uniref:Uncharacterized protein n=1 Tax=Dichomitus squalens TaxID=114155 RepID=A0A4Q9MEN3_9APHY|nr:hypothetical protein BD311DRAFT_790703 [Dichomitus squalens]